MKPKRLDRISNLPSGIIETILCLVPTKDAVRTSILSRDWRYKWTKIPKLVFKEKDMIKEYPLLPFLERRLEDTISKEWTRKCKLFNAIHQVLLLHDGPIFELTLSMDTLSIRDDDTHSMYVAVKTCEEIDQIITHLSRHNTLNKLSINWTYYEPEEFPLCEYKLPNLSSLHQLTHLSLQGCNLELEPTFSGFGSLTSLSLSVTTFRKTLQHLLSSCPLLKSFTLTLSYISRLTGDDDVTIIDIFKCLPLIEHLTIYSSSFECFREDGLPRKLSTALVHLKYICIEYLKLTEEFQIFFLGLLIRSSPNLEKIKIDEIGQNGLDENSVTLKEVSDICLEHLIELEINDFKEYQLELEFVKLILAKSPMLKKVKIFYGSWITNEKELEMCKILLRSPRASPKAEIIVERIVEIPYDWIWL